MANGMNSGRLRAIAVHAARDSILSRIKYPGTLTVTSRYSLTKVLKTSVSLQGYLSASQLEIVLPLLRECIPEGQRVRREDIEAALREKGLVLDIALSKQNSMLRACNALLSKAASAEGKSDVTEVMCESMTDIVGAAGTAGYSYNENGEIKSEERRLGDRVSRYSSYLRPMGEKGQITYAFNLAGKAIEEASNNPVVAHTFIMIQQSVKKWFVRDRKFWLEWGMRADLPQRVRDAFAKAGIDKLPARLAGKDANDRKHLEGLVAEFKKKLYVPKEFSETEECDILKAYLKAQGIEKDSDEGKKIVGLCGLLIPQINRLEVEHRIFAGFYVEAKRVAADWAKENKNKDYAELLNLGQDVFKTTLRHFVEAQDDIEADLERLRKVNPNVTYADIKENYNRIVDFNRKPLILLIANEQYNILVKQKANPIFADRQVEALTNEILDKISPALAVIYMQRDFVNNLALAKKQLEINYNSAEGIRQLTEAMINGAIPLEQRFAGVIGTLVKIFQTNGKKIGASIGLLVREGDKQNIVIVAAQKPEPDKKGGQERQRDKDKDNEDGKHKVELVGQKIPLGEKISGYVAEIGGEIFVSKGEVYITRPKTVTENGVTRTIMSTEKLSDESIKELKITHPSVYEQLKGSEEKGTEGILNKPDESFMSHAMVVEEKKGDVTERKVLGVVNVDGIKLTREEQSLLRTINNILTIATRDAESYQEILRLARTDQLSGLPNQRAFEEKLRDEFKRAQLSDQPLSVIAIDLVDNKRFNNGFTDTSGAHKGDHLSGDWVIISFARLINEFKNTMGIKDAKYQLAFNSRRGGAADEFYVCLPNASTEEASQYAKGLLGFLSEHPVEFKQGPFTSADKGPRTLSFRAGIATYQKSGGTMQFISLYEQLLFHSDKAEREIKANNLSNPVLVASKPD